VGLSNQSNCWVCEGWAQIKFQISINSVEIFEPLRRIPPTDRNVKLYLDFENYKGEKMVYCPEERSYILYRMVPPKAKLNYFFMCNNIPLVEKEEDIENEFNH
jgi:hypothetical protein